MIDRPILASEKIQRYFYSLTRSTSLSIMAACLAAEHGHH
jgi:hypothetical protein